MFDFAYGELALKPAEFWDLTWGEFIRMQRGYYREQEKRAHNVASILAAIYNTIPKGRGQKNYTAEDFLPKNTSPAKISESEQRELALQALENSKRFEKGVIYETL